MSLQASTSTASRPVSSLTKAMFGFVALGAVLAAAAGWYLLTIRIAEFQKNALVEAINVRAGAAELDFSRTLHQEWENARVLAADIVRRDPSAVRASLDLIVGDNNRVSWAGIAAVDGTVIEASGGMLKGHNVAQRPWFQRGLEGNFAGDVHEAVLLANLLPSVDGEPRRFMDLATPVQDEEGDVSGVLGLHLNQEWALRHLRETADALGIDVFVINREGLVVMATDETASRDLDLPSTRAAMAGLKTTSIETWPDGASYFTTVIPQVGYGDLPSFGWSMIARIDADAVRSDPPIAMVGAVAGVFGLALLLLTIIFVMVFVRPFAKLAGSAEAILKGEDVYPYESRSTSEVQILSAAVARLQGLLLR